MMAEELPVLDDWDGYVFPEEGLDASRQRLAVRDPMTSTTSGSFAPYRLDEAQDGAAATMMKTLVEVNRVLEGRGDDARGAQVVDELALNGPQGDPVRWFLFSPYEVFLEKVLAERLKTLEIGELR